MIMRGIALLKKTDIKSSWDSVVRQLKCGICCITVNLFYFLVQTSKLLIIRIYKYSTSSLHLVSFPRDTHINVLWYAFGPAGKMLTSSTRVLAWMTCSTLSSSSIKADFGGRSDGSQSWVLVNSWLWPQDRPGPASTEQRTSA